MEKVELNQATMREEMDVMKENINDLQESMMNLDRKEYDPQMVVDARNIDSTSHQIPLVDDLEFGLPQGYSPPKGVTIIVPTPVGILVVNLVI